MDQWFLHQDSIAVSEITHEIFNPNCQGYDAYPILYLSYFKHLIVCGT